MNDDPAIQAAHLDLSAVDWELRQFALANPEYRRRANFPLFAKPSAVHINMLQSWPTFIRRSKMEELKSISVAVSNLIRRIPEKVFGNDPEAISRYYGVGNPAMTRVWLSQPSGIEEGMSRGDFVLTASGFKCIEFNLMANLGGWETALLAEMHGQTPLTARFIQDRQLNVSYTDTLQVMFKAILQDARTIFPERHLPLNIAFAVPPGEGRALMTETFSVFGSAYRKTCGEVGASTEGQFLACTPDQLSLESDGSLKLGQHRIHVVLAIYTSNPGTVLRSFKSQKVKLYNSPACSLLNDKRMLAILSMLAKTDRVSADERALIEKAIPWTRTIDVPPSLQQVYQTLSAEEIVARREELVLKNANSMGGKDVYIGRFIAPSEWASLVGKALGAPRWVIQEHLQSVPLLYQHGEDGCSAHDVVWGPFVFGQTFGGMILRMQPQTERGPVNLSLNATEGMIFELAD